MNRQMVEQKNTSDALWVQREKYEMMKDTKPKDRGSDKKDIPRWEKNPYKMPALIRLMGVSLCCAGYLTMRFFVNIDLRFIINVINMNC